MTAFQVFATCFFAGALPGLIMVIRNMAWSYRLTKSVERLAREEGQWFDFSALETKRKILRDPDSLVTESDSAKLADAKRYALAQGRRIIKRHFLWGGVMFVGAILGAAVGYQISTYLGLLPVG